jgi:hypothetical protein
LQILYTTEINPGRNKEDSAERQQIQNKWENILYVMVKWWGEIFFLNNGINE